MFEWFVSDDHNSYHVCIYGGANVLKWPLDLTRRGWMILEGATKESDFFAETTQRVFHQVQPWLAVNEWHL